MKEKLNLSRRHETFTDFNGMKPQVTLHEDGGYTLAFVSNPLPSLKGLTYEGKMNLFTAQSIETGYVVKYRGKDSIFVGRYQKGLKRSGNRIFSKKEWVHVVRFDGKRIVKSKLCVVAYGDELDFLLAFFGVECLKEGLNPCALSLLFSKKPVLAGIFRQSITNGRDLLKVWLKGSYGLSRIPSYKVTQDFLNAFSFSRTIPTVADLRDFTTSLEAGMRLLADGNQQEDKEKDNTRREHQMLFRDLVEDAVRLNLRVNPRWSYKRMLLEHQRTTEELMLRSPTELSDRNFYGQENTLHFQGLECSVLSTEREVFREASEMHHCIFNNYLDMIRRGDYLALSVTEPIRCTVGIRLRYKVGAPWDADTQQEKVVSFDQVQRRHDLAVNNDIRETIRSLVEDNKDFFGSLMKEARDSFRESAKADRPSPERVAVPVRAQDDLPF